MACLRSIPNPPDETDGGDARYSIGNATNASNTTAAYTTITLASYH